MEAQKQLNKQKKHWYKKWWGVLILASVILYFGSALVVRFTTDPSTPRESKPAATPAKEQAQALPKQAPDYEVKIVGNTYADPTSRRLTFTVTNKGNSDGNPACNIYLENEAKTYTGYDYVEWNTPVKPGEFKYFEGLVVITNEGAAYATKSRVSCAERSI